MEEWHDLFVAAAGASAALMGLIFVGVSINLTRILSIPTLPGPALISLVLLLTIMIESLMLLIPHESITVSGAGILLIGFIVWVTIVVFDISIFRKKDNQYKKPYLLNIFLNQFATVPYFIAGIVMINGNLYGLYWFASAMLFSFFKASFDAWVLLVEINR